VITGAEILGSKRVVLIGNGKMAIDCLARMRGQPELSVLLVVTDPLVEVLGSSLKDYCVQQRIPYLATGAVNSPEVIEKLIKIEPGIIFNINSYKILKEKILTLPNVQIVNFHNGPLPRYGGVNICSWAIINAEEIHGVTWHFIDRGIDTGDIIAQKFFEITPKETAISLIMKCIREGTELFGAILPNLIANTTKVQKQNKSQASYYSLKDIPNGGWVDFQWTFERFDSFIRGLTFHPMANNFVLPKTKYKSKEFYIKKISKVGEKHALGQAGEIIDLNKDQISVRVNDAVVGIENVLDDEGREITIKTLTQNYQIEVGGILGK
jgi:methionyl-tRNA formyltransferase